MAGRDMTASDHRAHKVAVTALGGEIDGRWPTLLTALDLAKVKRRAEMTGGVPDDDDRVSVALQREVGSDAGVGNQPHATDHRRRQYRPAARLII